MPALYVKTGGTHETVVQPYVKTGGVWEPVLNIWVKTGGVWELGYTGFSVSATPVSEYVPNSNSTITSSFFTATPTGGIGPFTYSWSQVSGGAINILFPSVDSTNFRVTGMTFGETRTGVFKCSVTDTTTSVVSDSNTIEVTFEYI